MSEPKPTLSRERVDELVPKLDTVADVVEELAVMLTGQATNQRGQESGHGQPRSRPPYPIDAEELRDQLIESMHTTADAISEHRGSAYDGPIYPLGIAAWIKRNRIALTTMPSGPDLHHDLCAAIDAANRAVNRDERPHPINHAMLAQANRQVVTAGQMERLARQLGDRGKGLTARRIEALRKQGKLAGSRSDGHWWYRVGDILKAHDEAKLYRTRRRIQASLTPGRSPIG